MAITFINATTADSGAASQNSVTVTKPTGVNSGDCMVALVELDSLAVGDANWGFGTGWTKVEQNGLTVDGAEWAWAWKIAGGSEPSNYTFSASASTPGQGSVVGIIVAYSGVDNVSPINTSNSQTDDTSDPTPWTETAPTITPTVDNCMIVWLAVADKTGQVNATFAVPASYNNRATKNGWTTNPWNSIAAADILQTTAAATGAQSADWDATGLSAARVGIHVALKPATVADGNQKTYAKADVTSGLWNPSVGGSTLFSMIDETTYDDADYIYSPYTPVYNYCEVLLSGLADPYSPSGHIVSYRYRAFPTSGITSLTVVLYQSTTLISSYFHSGINNVFQDGSFTLTAGEADSITDYTDLRLRFIATSPP